MSDIIISGDGADALYGHDGADDMFAEVGDNHLFGGAGADTLVGGGDFDFARYDFAAAGVFVSLDLHEGFTGEAEGDEIFAMGGLVGSLFADTLVGDGESQPDLRFSGR